MANYIDAMEGKHTNGSEQFDGVHVPMTKEEFKKKYVRKGIATWKVGASLDKIQEGVESMNEFACDDFVDQGDLLEDISYEVFGVNKKTKEIIIKCTANAENWIAEAFADEE